MLLNTAILLNAAILFNTAILLITAILLNTAILLITAILLNTAILLYTAIVPSASLLLSLVHFSGLWSRPLLHFIPLVYFSRRLCRSPLCPPPL
jgi:hypothetical protein